MKQKLSISVEENTIKQIEKMLKDNRFRNKSHLIEYSLNKFFKEVQNDI